MAITVAEIETLLGLQASGDTRSFARLSGFASAGADSIVFAQDAESLTQALATLAGLILSSAPGDARVLQVKQPKYAFALAGQWLDRQNAERRGREGSAAQGAELVSAAAVVEPGASVAAGTSVGAGSVVEAGAMVGANCVIAANVVIHGCVTLGDRCLVQSGAVLGGMGFGYVRGPHERHVRFPQIGTLWIGDDVEIGAGTTIDRGALGETRIGRGTKIDNLVHIAHNCVIGEDVLIAAQVGMAGSCIIEDNAMLGGQVGLGERVTIGRGVILGGQGGVLPGKRIDGEGVVYWGTPAQPVREYLRGLAKMRR